MIESGLSSKARRLELQAAEDRALARLRAPVETPSERRQALVIVLAALMFAAVFAARMLVHDPDALLANFYLVPVTVLAFQFGARAGMLAALVGLGLVFAWSLIETVHVGPLGYVSREAALLLAGAVVGRFSERLRADVAERRRAERNLALYADQLERANHHLARSVERLEAIGEIARAVGDEADLERVLSLVLAHGGEIVAARSLAVYLIDGDEMVAVETNSLPPELTRRLPIAGSLPGTVLHAGRAFSATAEENRGRMRQLMPGGRSALLIPLTFRGEVLGVLVALDRADGRGFEAEDEELLSSVAASAATAVATVRSVAATRLRLSLEAAEKARARWARELHDETLQGLTGARMVLSAGLAREDFEALRSAAETADAHLAEEVGKLRELIAELRPAALDDLGLGPAIESLANRQAAIGDFSVELALEIGDDGRLPEEIENATYRIVQEALNNAVKHSGASVVTLRVSQHADFVEIAVADDGHGFDPARVDEGFGLTGMRERAELEGGRLTVDSVAGGPTCISAVLPLPPLPVSGDGARRLVGIGRRFARAR